MRRVRLFTPYIALRTFINSTSACILAQPLVPLPMSFADFDQEGYKGCVKQFMRFLARSSSMYHFKLEVFPLLTIDSPLATSSNEDVPSVVTTGVGVVVTDQTSASSRGRSASCPSTPVSQAASLESLLGTSPANKLHRIPSRSPSPEDLLGGSRAGRILEGGLYWRMREGREAQEGCLY